MPVTSPLSPPHPLFGRARGFTLIELVVVIVILGVLAAFAIPRYIDLRAQAKLAAVKEVYAAAASAARLNFAAARLGQTVTPVTDGASLLAKLDDTTQSEWFAPGGPYMWSPDSSYGIEVTMPETTASAAVLAIVDDSTSRIFP